MTFTFTTRRALDQERAANARLLRSVTALSAELHDAQEHLRRARRQIDALNAEAERRAAEAERVQQRRLDWASAARNGLHVVIAGGGRAA